MANSLDGGVLRYTNSPKQVLGGQKLDTGAQFTSRRQRKSPSIAHEVWDVTMDGISAAELATINTQLDAVLHTGAITWTPPNGTARQWRVSERSQARDSNATYRINLSLEYIPGV